MRASQFPNWADPDGIIPLTPLAKETTLLERVQERLRADEIDTSDFAEVMGKPLDGWLATEFFKHHTTQFKKRPIAWQLQSGRFTSRTPPAFAMLCFIITSWIWMRFRSFAPSISAHCGSGSKPSCAASWALRPKPAAIAKSNAERNWRTAVLELQKFDTILEAVAVTGFGPASLHAPLRQYAIDDAMLALKARWLRRLAE